jgi:anti-anti-sigma factor
VVQAKGEVDSSTASDLTAQLHAALQQAGTQSSRLLIVDLQFVTYFGSAGLNAVLDCHREGVEAGTSVRLVADNGLVVRPIEVTNLDSVLELYPTLPDALQGRDTEQGQ